MRIALGLAAVALALCAACGSSAGSAPPPSSADPGTGPEIQLGTQFTMTPGAHSLISGTTVRVMFDGVSADSRCKQGQTCVWEGDAAVDFTVDGAPIQLHTSKRVGPPDATTQGYRVQLMFLTADAKDATILVSKA
jgi:hypothetical protein